MQNNFNDSFNRLMAEFCYSKYFKCQLAKPFEERLLHTYPKAFILSPKLDGIRCLWFADNPDYIFSRNMKPFKGFELLIKQIKIGAENAKVDFMDGELMLQGSDSDFNKVQSVVMSEKHELKNHIVFNIFFVATFNENAIPENQNAVLNKVCCKALGLRPVLSERILAVDVLHEANKLLHNSSYEGIMLRNPHKLYFFGRSKDLLKYKKFFELDCKLLKMIEGNGRLKNTLGTLDVMYEDSLYGNIFFNVGSGFTDEQRANLWNSRDNLKGKSLTVKYQNLTAKGVPRFPTFIGFKGDR